MEAQYVESKSIQVQSSNRLQVAPFSNQNSRNKGRRKRPAFASGKNYGSQRFSLLWLLHEKLHLKFTWWYWWWEKGYLEMIISLSSFISSPFRTYITYVPRDGVGNSVFLLQLHHQTHRWFGEPPVPTDICFMCIHICTWLYMIYFYLHMYVIHVLLYIVYLYMY